VLVALVLVHLAMEHHSSVSQAIDLLFLIDEQDLHLGLEAATDLAMVSRVLVVLELDMVEESAHSVRV
jgi:hypothetical protein